MNRQSVAGALAGAFSELAGDGDGFERYRDDPVRFFHDVLGRRTWAGQERILRAVAAHDWTTVRSGHRVSKTDSAAGLAIWFVMTRGPGARVIMTGPTAKILSEGLWRAVRALYRGARRPLGGELGVSMTTGIRWPDDRQIVGITADEAEAFQGLAAAEIMFCVDEASGVSDRIFEALLGNLAGGGRMLLTSNPTKSEGFFADSHRSPRFERIHLSSEDSPNVEADPSLHIKGLATRAWLADCVRLWGGRDGMLYRIRCLGEFVEARVGRMFTADMLAAATARWETTPAEGRLIFGVDPAGDGGDGDASAFVGRRGLKVVHVSSRRGLTADAHLVEVLGLVGEHRGGGDVPIVVLDRDGLVGHRVYVVLKTYSDAHPTVFDLRGIRGSEHAKRRPLEIDGVRDELWFSLVDAFNEGLAVPPHVELEGDLASIRFDKLVNGRAKVLPKRAIRRELGRSPDLGDALALACYVEMARADEQAEDADDLAEPVPLGRVWDTVQEQGSPFDPHTAGDVFSGGGRRGRDDD